MKLKELAAKPQLVKVVLDDKEIVEEYGEPLEFFVHDKQPLAEFIKFSVTAGEDQNYSEMVEFCSELILDEAGAKIMEEGLLLPNSILIKCINSVVEQLGK
tara:strand:+ start:9012 stop:9314 length:303 start_codon:yes stop_codon:yes gene_type:complete